MAVQQVIPACGITVFNVWDITYEWWLAYVDVTKRIIEKRKR